MKVTAEKNEKIGNMIFGDIYPLYLNKLEKKGRSKAELDEVIKWLTNFDEKQLQEMIAQKATFRTFFEKAQINPNAQLIKGVVCGYPIEDIGAEFKFYRQCRYLDKLVDELAKGQAMEKILKIK
ncbi:MAG: DUF2200 domain-containing protein [Bacteroidota bacterium]|nr:DUF2200 domain-containing protein [Bacteroidota bacterium]